MQDFMHRNAQAMASALDATLDIIAADASQFDVERFRFADSRLEYELRLLPINGTAQLAADPVEPIQGCPMLEFSFGCSEVVIGRSAYGDQIAIRFYDDGHTPNGLRLTLTALPDGNWYVWANALDQPNSG